MIDINSNVSSNSNQDDYIKSIDFMCKNAKRDLDTVLHESIASFNKYYCNWLNINS